MAPTKPIAVIGMGCRLPGQSDNPEALWEMLIQGRNGYSQPPSERLNLESYQHPSRKLGTAVIEGAHFLHRDISVFDAPFFGISPADAKAMDPQQRLMLEVVYEALENAGLPMEATINSDTSCYVGCFTNDWLNHLSRDPEAAPKYAITGVGSGMLANRVSWFFNWHGPSLTLDTACSSSLVALHLACQSLHTGESKVSIAAGTNLILSPPLNIFLSNLSFLGSDGKSKSFDSSADGYGRGEGLGVVVLKPLEDAVRDGDCIRAVIRGTGVNQDGHTSGITLPSAEAQISLIESVYKKAGLDFAETSYFEAHGTGTVAGDSVEMRAIGASITKGRTPPDILHTGSIKSNIGHTEGTAGIAGLIKTVLMLEKGLIPPSVNLKTLNPKIPFEKYCVKVPREVIPWNTVGVKRASINSFGYGGTNAHAIIDDAAGYFKITGIKGNHNSTTDLDDDSLSPSRHSSGGDSGYLVQASAHSPSAMSLATSVESLALQDQSRHWLLVFSAHDEGAVADMKKQHFEYVKASEKRTIQDTKFLDKLAYCLFKRRSSLPWKSYAVLANSGDGVELFDIPDSRPIRSLAKPKIGFVFTGQGAQWAGMGQQLLSYTIFEESINAADAYLRNELGSEWSVKEQLSREAELSSLHLAKYSQPICTIVQIALVELLESWGVTPSAVVGHSSGEIAAAVCAGSISRQDGWKIAYWRGILSSDLKTRHPDLEGSMMAVGISAETAQEYINSVSIGDKKAQIACFNSPESLTLSGDEDAINEIETKIKATNQFARKLRVENAYHSHHMQHIAQDYLASIKDCKPQNATSSEVKMISSVTGMELKLDNLDPTYWVENLTSPVQFSAALSTLLKGESRRRRRGEAAVDILVEIGPHSALQGPARQIFKAEGFKNIVYGTVLQRGKDAVATALQLVGLLHTSGVSVNVDAANRIDDEKSVQVQLTDLPTYPWNHGRSYWTDSRLSKASRLRDRNSVDLLGAPVDDSVLGDPSWRQFLRTSDFPWIRDHKIQSSILYPAAGMVCMVIEAGRQLADPDRTLDFLELRDVRFERPMVIPDDDQGIETKLELLRPKTNGLANDWFEFRISSSSQTKPLEYNCSGFVAIRYKSHSPSEHVARERSYGVEQFRLQLQAIEQSCRKSIKHSDFYAKTDSLDLQYGPAFQGLTDIRHEELSACGNVVIYDTKATIPSRYEDPHLLHPSTLDSMIQLIFAAIGSCSDDTESKAAIPVFIEHLKICSNEATEAGTVLRGYAKASVSGIVEHIADIAFGDEAGATPFVSITGLTCRSIDDGHDQNSSSGTVRQRYGHIRTLPDLRVASAAGLHQYIESKAFPPTAGEGISHHIIAQILELVVHIDPYSSLLEMHQGGTLFIAEAFKALSDEQRKTLRLAKWEVASQDTQVREALDSKAEPFAGRVAFSVTEDGKPADDTTFDAIIMPGDHDAGLLEQAATYIKRSGFLILIAKNWEAAEHLKETCAAAGLHKHIHIPAGEHHHLVISTRGQTHPVFLEAFKPPVTLILPDKPSFMCMALANELSQQINRQGLSVSKARLGVDTDGIDSRIDGAFCISLLALESHLALEEDAGRFDAFKRLLLKNRRLLWISGSSGPHSQTVNGVFRSVRNENPHLDIASLALDSTTLSQVDQNAALINQLLFTDCDDKEFAVHAGVCQISRFTANDELNHFVSNQSSTTGTQLMRIGDATVNLQLAVRKPGLLNTMCFKAAENASQVLKSDEVEYETRSVGVNFRDLLILMGQLSAPTIGFEAGGVIKSVGSAITRLKPGDRVYTIGEGCFRTRHRTKGAQVHVIPNGLSFSEAASVPVVFMTALACLRDCARLRKGETILIHAGAGGVGQAAIQLAKHYGATILTTVGSVTKAQMLQDVYGIPADHIFSSRDSSFASDVKRLTNGRGVDVVLNSLSGELLRQTWKCIAPFGRFVEIGIKDIEGRSSLEMAPFKNSATFSFYNLMYMTRHLADKTALLLQDVHHLLLQNVIKPVHTVAEFPLSNILGAMRILQAGKHMGKLVITLDPDDTIPVHPTIASTLSLKSDATYVIAGGLGGLGRSLASHMARSGAKSIVFLSRSGAADEKAAGVKADLKSMGAQAFFYACDIANADQLKATLLECAQSLPPVAGCVQSAMVLRDGIFETMTHDMYKQSLQPKVAGSWNLHKLLPRNLDFFILLSSISGVTGNPGQANYAAGNTFMDSLAYYRRSRGLAALSLDLGLMLDVGFVAERQGASNLKKWESVGLGEDEFRSLMTAAMKGNVPAVSASSSDSDQGACLSSFIPEQIVTGLATGGHVLEYRVQTPFYFSDPRFKELVQAETLGTAAEHQQGDGSNTGDAMRAALKASTSAAEAAQVVAEAVRDKLAQITDNDASNIDMGKAVHAYGVDSLLAVELRNWILKELQCGISLFDLLRTRSILALGKEILVTSKLAPPVTE